MKTRNKLRYKSTKIKNKSKIINKTWKGKDKTRKRYRGIRKTVKVGGSLFSSFSSLFKNESLKKTAFDTFKETGTQAVRTVASATQKTGEIVDKSVNGTLDTVSRASDLAFLIPNIAIESTSNTLITVSSIYNAGLRVIRYVTDENMTEISGCMKDNNKNDTQKITCIKKIMKKFDFLKSRTEQSLYLKQIVVCTKKILDNGIKYLCPVSMFTRTCVDDDVKHLKYMIDSEYDKYIKLIDTELSTEKTYINALNVKIDTYSGKNPSELNGIVEKYIEKITEPFSGKQTINSQKKTFDDLLKTVDEKVNEKKLKDDEKKMYDTIMKEDKVLNSKNAKLTDEQENKIKEEINKKKAEVIQKKKIMKDRFNYESKFLTIIGQLENSVNQLSVDKEIHSQELQELKNKKKNYDVLLKLIDEIIDNTNLKDSYDKQLKIFLDKKVVLNTKNEKLETLLKRLNSKGQTQKNETKDIRNTIPSSKIADIKMNMSRNASYLKQIDSEIETYQKKIKEIIPIIQDKKKQIYDININEINILIDKDIIDKINELNNKLLVEATNAQKEAEAAVKKEKEEKAAEVEKEKEEKAAAAAPAEVEKEKEEKAAAAAPAEEAKAAASAEEAKAAAAPAKEAKAAASAAAE
jgi:hypothetical protein